MRTIYINQVKLASFFTHLRKLQTRECLPNLDVGRQARALNGFNPRPIPETALEWVDGNVAALGLCQCLTIESGHRQTRSAGGQPHFQAVAWFQFKTKV